MNFGDLRSACHNDDQRLLVDWLKAQNQSEPLKPQYRRYIEDTTDWKLPELFYGFYVDAMVSIEKAPIEGLKALFDSHGQWSVDWLLQDMLPNLVKLHDGPGRYLVADGGKYRTESDAIFERLDSVHGEPIDRENLSMFVSLPTLSNGTTWGLNCEWYIMRNGSVLGEFTCLSYDPYSPAFTERCSAYLQRRANCHLFKSGIIGLYAMEYIRQRVPDMPGPPTQNVLVSL